MKARHYLLSVPRFPFEMCALQSTDCIMDCKGEQIGVGKTSFSSEQASKMIGQHGKKPLVHYDYLYLEGC